ncbi:hypothetical protein COEREDRAFT_82767 [Coemansia reversa NRRL 1564]|uniref:Uncharacterized protein n=1 Tax=Coemansia reversa (strain ATCC 12441 / NRRL 1564) TaxID=763665 RepID=A0A2G5B657_COERN|nr:hypothetical protein COEREDRAFT_82767 [Coemansia reversa NRRL 1564]|eukprot:PIA14506.1 hypothetical protein COEREDRAFT_82767 [Coemansia reversa NRRL 1564]
MSYQTVIESDGKTDLQRYDEFMSYMLKDGVLERALDEDYEGDYNGIIQERIAADFSPLSITFGDENKDLLVERHRAMLIRHGVDSDLRVVCRGLDSQIKYDLSEQDIESIKALELTEDEIEDEVYLRPFCLYEVDIKNAYKKDLSALPENAAEFAKLALDHEMDCQYEDSDDDDDEDWEEGEDDEEEDEEDDEEDGEGEEGASSKGKGKGVPVDNEWEDVDEEDEEKEHVHGANCCHGHDDVTDLDEGLPFDESEVSVSAADVGLALLKDHKTEVVELLEKIAGAKIDSFKSYHFPGRHYVVAWLKNFGIFGIRISYPMLINDTDDELDSEDESDEDEPSASASK